MFASEGHDSFHEVSPSYVDMRTGLFQAFRFQLLFGICYDDYNNLEVRYEDNNYFEDATLHD